MEIITAMYEKTKDDYCLMTAKAQEGGGGVWEWCVELLFKAL